VQVGTFADSGIPALFQEAYRLGVEKKRCEVKLAGGAELTASGSISNLQIGRRNILAARGLLWRNGLMTRAEATGGAVPRTVRISVDDGRVEVCTGRDMALL
jgi:chemotaxis protein CheD